MVRFETDTDRLRSCYTEHILKKPILGAEFSIGVQQRSSTFNVHPGLEEFSIGYHVHSNELHNFGEKTKIEGTSKMECARYGFRIDRKTSIGCFTKNGHDMVVIEDIGLDANFVFIERSKTHYMGHVDRNYYDPVQQIWR